jgi:hypothetical protein
MYVFNKFCRPSQILNFPSAPTSSSSASSSTESSSSTTSSSASSSTTASASSLLGRIFRRRTNRLDSSSPQLESGIFPNTTLGRTLLNSSDLVHLPGNNSQVLAWTRSDENSNVTILNQVYVFTPFLPNFSLDCSCDFTCDFNTQNADFSKVLMLILVKILLLSTLRSGAPYSSTKLTAY